MSMRKTTLAPWQLLCSVHMEKVTSARPVTRCCTMGNPPLEVAPGSFEPGSFSRGDETVVCSRTVMCHAQVSTERHHYAYKGTGWWGVRFLG